MEILREAAGITAAILTLIGGWFYIRAIWLRTSTTRWSAWMIWTVTSVTGLATYYGSGARESVWVAVVCVLLCAAIFVVAVWRRSPGGLNRVEIFCLVGAVMSGVIWWASGSAVYGQIASVGIEMVAYVPVWLAARGENRLGWRLEMASSVVNLAAISQMTFGLLLYPVALLICNGIVLGMIAWQNRKVPVSPKPVAVGAIT